MRAKVEHPCRVIKRQFGYLKVRHGGLAKNIAQMFTLFALSHLWMAPRRLLGWDDVRNARKAQISADKQITSAVRRGKYGYCTTRLAVRRPPACGARSEFLNTGLVRPSTTLKCWP